MSIRCIICDYDLQQLDVRSNCPECGTAIEQSLHGDLLRYADQDWLRSVARGAQFISLSGIAILLAFIVMMLVAIITMLISFIGYTVDWVWTIISMPVAIVICVAPIVMIIGLWMFTSTEPRLQSPLNLRHLMLRSLSLAVIPMIGLWMMAFVNANLGTLPWWVPYTIAWAGFAVVVAHTMLFIKHMQSLDRRCAQVDEKRNALLEKYRNQGKGCAVILGLIGVIGSGLVFGPLAAMPAGVSISSLNIMILIWIAVISFARGTHKHIALEQAIASDHLALRSSDRSA